MAPDLPGWATKKETSESGYSSGVEDAIDELESGSIPPLASASPLKRKANLFAEVQATKRPKTQVGSSLKPFPRSISDSQVKNNAGPSSRPLPKKNVSISASANAGAPASKSSTKSSDTAFKPNGLLSQPTASGSASARPSYSRPTVDKSASFSSFKPTGLLRKARDVDLTTASSLSQAGNRTVDTTRRTRKERQRQRSISSPSPPPSLRNSSPECITISSDSDDPAVTSKSKAKGKEKEKAKEKGKGKETANSRLPRQRRNSGSVVITDFVPASSQKLSSQRQKKHLKSRSSVSSDDVIDLTKSDDEQARMNGNARPRPRPSDTKSKPTEFIHILDSDEEEEPVRSARPKVPLSTPSTSSASAPKSNPVPSSSGSLPTSSDTLARTPSSSVRPPPTPKHNTPEPMDIDMGMGMDFDIDMIPENDVSLDASSVLASTSKTISARPASPGKTAAPESSSVKVQVPESTLSTYKLTKPGSSSLLTSTLPLATDVEPSPKSPAGPQLTSPEALSSPLHSIASSPRPPAPSLLQSTPATAAHVPALSVPGSSSKPNTVPQHVAPHLASPSMPRASISSPSEGASSTAITSRPRPPHTPLSGRTLSLVQSQSVEPVVTSSTSSQQSNSGLVDRVSHKTETLQSVPSMQLPIKKPSNLFLRPREPRDTENPSPSKSSVPQESKVTPESTANHRPPALPRRRPSAVKASSSASINKSSPQVLGGTVNSIDASGSQSDATSHSNAPAKVPMKPIGSKSHLPYAKPPSLSGSSSSRPLVPQNSFVSSAAPTSSSSSASTSKPASLSLIDALAAASQTNSRPLFPRRPTRPKANGSISVADLNAFRRAKKDILEQNGSHYLQHKDDPDPREYAHSGKGKQKAFEKDVVMSDSALTSPQLRAFTTVEKGKGTGTGNDYTPDTPGQSNTDELDLLTQKTQDLLASDTHGISNLTLDTPEGSKSATPGTAADEMLSTNTEGMASLSLDTRKETAADLFNDDMDIDPAASSADLDESTDAEDHLRDDRSQSPRLRRSTRRQSGDVSMGSASSAASDDSDVEALARSPTPPRSDVPTPTVFGGYRVKRWADIREDLRHQQPKYLLARDLPSKLQDYINSRPSESRGHPQMRRIFEHEIYINSANTEHDAPAMKVDNSVDDEPCPPWEFYYTNDMWHTEDIPPPTREGLVGCDCVGDCAMNRNCACRKHQLEMAGEYASGDFAYHDGRVKNDARYVPIWECNDMCRCDGHCVNRVVQHGRTCDVKIVKTAEKGWGVFYSGVRKIPEGSFVGIYSGELVTFDVGEHRGTTYDQSGRTYMLDLDFYHIREKYENDHRFSIDAYHAGNFTRFMNHSCAPNCFLQPIYINDGELRKPLMAFFTARDVLPDEELTFSYFGELSEDELKDRIGGKTEKQDDPKAVFVPCRCGAKMCIGILFN